MSKCLGNVQRIKPVIYWFVSSKQARELVVYMGLIICLYEGVAVKTPGFMAVDSITLQTGSIYIVSSSTVYYLAAISGWKAALQIHDCGSVLLVSSSAAYCL